MRSENLKKSRIRRNYRSRRKIFGSPERPRMTVFRSGRHIYVQIIDDYAGVTLASSSTRAKGVREDVSYGGNSVAAEAIGTSIVDDDSPAIGLDSCVFEAKILRKNILGAADLFNTNKRIQSDLVS